jgi:p-aminobenzoyl-glutamate transporter AbgT
LNTFKEALVDLKLVTYLVYLAVSITLTWWVGRTLFRNGQVFLDEALRDERLAASVNHLLVVGFYLLNLGYVAVALKITTQIDSANAAMESLAWKVGFVLLVLGAIHFFNLYVLSRFRRRKLLESVPPPVPPTRQMPPPQPAAVPPPRTPTRYGPEWPQP